MKKFHRWVGKSKKLSAVGAAVILCAGLLWAESAGAWKVLAAGMITDPVLKEISGITMSPRDPGVLWVLNDSGNKPEIYSISTDGQLLSTVAIETAGNRDWEDLASFEAGGEGYLLIGDVGDNLGKRTDCRLYLVKEPKAGEVSAKPVAVIDFSYEDGPRDVESVAVDAAGKRILLMSKREKVVGLYELPLELKTPAKTLVAKKIAAMETLPQPTDEERAANPVQGKYLGQVTAISLSPGAADLAVLTYQGVFVYHRGAGETWPVAVGRVPEILPRHHLIQAEALCFARDGDLVFVTTERHGTSPLLRFERGK